MHQWSYRYFILSQHQQCNNPGNSTGHETASSIGYRLAYKLKADSTTFKGSYDLLPGCVVTEVQSVGIGVGNSKLSKKLYTFWIVWPTDKNSKQSLSADKKKNEDVVENSHHVNGPNESWNYNNDGDEDSVADDEDKIGEKKDVAISKDLKHIIEQQEVEIQRVQQSRTKAEEQLASHQAHDNSISLGVKVAAVAVGGALVGALTAGIGLVPYLTVVGLTAVASGGAAASALQWKKPPDSRLIVAFESMADAMEWKAAIESQICRLGDVQKPALPSFVDYQTISSIIRKSHSEGRGQWRSVRTARNVRILELDGGEQLHPIDGLRLRALASSEGGLLQTFLRPWVLGPPPAPAQSSSSLCRKAHVVVSGYGAQDTFLLLMRARCWPRHGSFKVVKEIDDHSDVVEVALPSPGPGQPLRFSRFWSLDDEGLYLLALSLLGPAHPLLEGLPTLSPLEGPPPGMDAVISIAPRAGRGLREATLVTCICQASFSGPRTQTLQLVDSFLEQHLLGLQDLIQLTRYGPRARREGPREDLLDMLLRPPEPCSINSAAAVAAPASPPTAKRERPPLFRRATTSSLLGLAPSRGPRGVTTVQPLEEPGEPLLPAPGPQEEGGQSPQTKKKGLKLFSLRRPTPAEDSDDADGPSPPSVGRRAFLGKASSSRAFSGPSPNEVASKLRSQIAAKQVELQRMDPVSGPADFHGPPDPSRLRDLRSQLQSLKDSYQAAVGEPYRDCPDPARPSTTFSRPPDDNAYSNGSCNAAAVDDIPSHWIQPYVKREGGGARRWSLRSWCEEAKEQVERSCTLLVENSACSLHFMDGVIANIILILLLMFTCYFLSLLEALIV